MGLLDIFRPDVSLLKREIKKLKKQVQASVAEGTHTDILNTNITGSVSTESTQKENSYRTYANIINTIYYMYNAEKSYGGEFIKSVIRTRVSFICGGGCTVIAKNQNTAKWITDFLQYNKMEEGSNLFRYVTTSEMEGKCLLVIKPSKDKTKVDVRIFPYLNNPYTVTVDPKDNQLIQKVEYKSEKTNRMEEIAKINRLVYIRTGGSPDRINATTPVVGNCLTDIENASRIKYDLRFNNHLFGRLTPAFKVNDMTEAKALNNLLQATDWKIGRTYVGTGELTLVGPPEGATKALTDELKTTCRIISLNTGIPVHWLSWPDLMSNRATADNLMEVVNAATIMEREIWEEGLTELIQKSMTMAFELKMPGATEAIRGIDDFEIRLPLISEAKMKEIQEVWIPLAEGDYITKDSVRNKIPGINPLLEKQMLEAEQEEKLAMIKNRFNNNEDHNHEDEDMEGDENMEEE